MKYLVVIGGFWAFAAVVFVVLEWAIPAIYSGTPSTSSSFNYGTSFVVPFSRTFAPWIAAVIALLGPLAALRAATDSVGAKSKRASRR